MTPRPPRSGGRGCFPGGRPVTDRLQPLTLESINYEAPTPGAIRTARRSRSPMWPRPLLCAGGGASAPLVSVTSIGRTGGAYSCDERVELCEPGLGLQAVGPLVVGGGQQAHHMAEFGHRGPAARLDHSLHGVVMPVMGRAVGTGPPSPVLDVYGPSQLLLLGLGGVVIAMLGALIPAGWAARARTATALRTE